MTHSRGEIAAAILGTVLLVVGLAGCGAQTGETGSGDELAAAQTQGHMGEASAMHRQGGHMMSMGDMMEHARAMHMDFQQMSDQDHWMRQGSMMPGGQHMMSLSNHLAMMTESMQEAMGDMQGIMQEYGEEGAPRDMHLEQMQQHMQAMTEQLQAMRQLMAEMPAAPSQ